MALITISNPALVRPLDGCRVERYIAGAAMTAAYGKIGRVDSNGEVVLADATTAAGADGIVGIIVVGDAYDKDGDIADGETLSLVVFGRVYLGGGTTLDETAYHFIGTTAGRIADVAPQYFRVIGIPDSQTVLFVQPVATPAGS
jgi:hypothetical protein